MSNIDETRMVAEVDSGAAGGATAQPVVSGGMPKLALVAIAIAAIGLTLTLLHEYRSFIAPMFLAINLLVTAYPIYTFLVRRGIPKALASLATGLSVFLILIVGLGALVWSITKMVGALTQYSDRFTEMYNESLQFLARFGFSESSLLEQLKTISPSNILNFVGGLVTNASGWVGIILVMITGIVFMMMDIPTMGRRLAITERLQPSFSRALTAFARGIRQYWLVTTVFGLIVALLDGVLLVAVGVSLPLVWVVLSFITNYIPNIGFVIGLIPPVLLALFDKGAVAAIVVLVAYTVLNFVIQSIIQPKFAGDAVGITPTVSFVSLLLWTAVFGGIGALVALPCTLLVKAILIDTDPRLRWVNALIAANPDPKEHVTG